MHLRNLESFGLSHTSPTPSTLVWNLYKQLIHSATSTVVISLLSLFFIVISVLALVPVPQLLLLESRDILLNTFI